MFRQFCASMGRVVWTLGPTGRRSGGLTPETAYNGTGRDAFFMTPESFFESSTLDNDPADTSGGVTGVLDSNGVVRRVRASGAAGCRMVATSLQGLWIITDV